MWLWGAWTCHAIAKPFSTTRADSSYFKPNFGAWMCLTCFMGAECWGWDFAPMRVSNSRHALSERFHIGQSGAGNFAAGICARGQAGQIHTRIGRALFKQEEHYADSEYQTPSDTCLLIIAFQSFKLSALVLSCSCSVLTRLSCVVRLHGFRWPASQVYKLMILVANVLSLSLSLAAT